MWSIPIIFSAVRLLKLEESEPWLRFLSNADITMDFFHNFVHYYQRRIRNVFELVSFHSLGDAKHFTLVRLTYNYYYIFCLLHQIDF